MATYDEIVHLDATAAVDDAGSGSVLKDRLKFPVLAYLLLSAAKTVAKDQLGLDAVATLAFLQTAVLKEHILDWVAYAAFDVSDRGIVKETVDLAAVADLGVTHEGYPFAPGPITIRPSWRQDVTIRPSWDARTIIRPSWRGDVEITPL